MSEAIPTVPRIGYYHGSRERRGEKPKEVIELPESPDGSLPAAALISHLSLERFIYSVGVKAMSALSD